MVLVRKAFLGGEAVPVTALTGVQRRALRASIAARRGRRFGTVSVPPADRDWAATINTSATRLRQVAERSRSPVTTDLTDIAAKRPAGQITGLVPRGQHVHVQSGGVPAGAAAEAITVHPRHGIVRSGQLGGDAASSAVMRHELAHLVPGRSPWRMRQIGADPVKLAREEARADAVARRTGPASVGSGYEEAAMFHREQAPSRSLQQVPLVGRRLAAGRARRVAAMSQRMGLPLGPREAAEYTRVRASAGAPISAA